MDPGSPKDQPHNKAHPQVPPSDLDVTWITVVGFVGAIVIFVFIVAVQILFERTYRAEYYQKVVAEVPAELEGLRAGQLEHMNTYRLVDEKAGIAAIPIDQAMQLIARDPSILAAIPQSQPAEQTPPAATTPAAPPGGAQ